VGTRSTALAAWLKVNGFIDLFVDHVRIADGVKWRESAVVDSELMSIVRRRRSLSKAPSIDPFAAASYARAKLAARSNLACRDALPCSARGVALRQLLAFAFKHVPGRQDLLGEVAGRVGLGGARNARGRLGRGQGPPAASAEQLFGLVRKPAGGAGRGQRGAARCAKAAARPVVRGFGDYVRAARAAHAETDVRFSLRQVAQRIGVEPAYLSKIERGLVAPPSEATIIRLATDLGEDPDVLLALAGKVGSDLQAIILRRPKQFAELIRQLKNAPDHALLKVVREVRDGKW
jgi:HTH-type transcriptional regulator, competence development regulator